MLRPAPESRRARTRMVMRHLAGRGIRDQRVLAAMRWAPREWFLPPHLAGDAFSDGPLPIGSGQTISQPYIVALMTERLPPPAPPPAPGTGERAAPPRALRPRARPLTYLHGARHRPPPEHERRNSLCGLATTKKAPG